MEQEREQRQAEQTEKPLDGIGYGEAFGSQSIAGTEHTTESRMRRFTGMGHILLKAANTAERSGRHKDHDPEQ